MFCSSSPNVRCRRGGVLVQIELGDVTSLTTFRTRNEIHVKRMWPRKAFYNQRDSPRDARKERSVTTRRAHAAHRKTPQS
jgi:hypothetical protein